MIIVDTNVWDAALRSPTGASHFVLRNVLAGGIVAGASTALFLEYEDVLKRPDHLSASKLNLGQIDLILSALAARVEPIHIHFRWRPTLRDPKDDMVLEAAVNGGAETIITFNLKDFENANQFGIEILRPGDFVRRLKQ